MATEDEERSAEAPPPPSDAYAQTPAGDGSLKRKMSSVDGSDDGAAKRMKQERGDTPVRSTTSDGPSEYRDTKQNPEQGRRPSATTEEKQRGKRLFGGLLNTLSQKTSNSQQRRRQEIERRQLDKMQQQTAEEDKERAERREALHEIRMEQQIVWEEQVMRSRHAKMLKLAQFLQTKSTPTMHFLPWKLRRREEETIESQVRDCKASISRELEDFKGRKEHHLKRYGPRRVSDATPSAEPAAAPSPGPYNEAPPPESTTTQPQAEDIAEKTVAPLHDMHDDSGDVLVEAEEDTVIY